MATRWKRYLAAFLIACAMGVHLGGSATSLEVVSAQAYFPPERAARTALLQAIDDAKVSLYLAMDVFTDQDIKQALCRALARGVSVHGLLDRRMSGDRQQWTRQGLYLEELRARGADMRLSAGPERMASRFAVIDETMVVTGSIAWDSGSLGSDRGTMLVLTGPEHAKVFLKHWRDIN